MKVKMLNENFKGIYIFVQKNVQKRKTKLKHLNSIAL